MFNLCKNISSFHGLMKYMMMSECPSKIHDNATSTFISQRKCLTQFCFLASPSHVRVMMLHQHPRHFHTAFLKQVFGEVRLNPVCIASSIVFRKQCDIHWLRIRYFEHFSTFISVCDNIVQSGVNQVRMDSGNFKEVLNVSVNPIVPNAAFFYPL